MKYSSTFEETGLISQDFSPIKDWTSRSSRRKSIKKRKRKSIDQLHILSQEFKTQSEWDKEMMTRLAKKTGLSEAQIYKWSWDQKKKLQVHDKLKNNKNIHLSEIFNRLPEIPILFGTRETFNNDTNTFECSEVISPRGIDYEFYLIQKNYRYGIESMSQIKTSVPNCLDNFLEEFSRF
ncbi:hypothetical protein SteCoe_30660 [Stentor coeruleus]|uniref:Homeobox domain-containing protein n=1 Tax=Stentor coeruleus TaxID=5963 RepID=A0A1R2B335_9CILI|nr:hypothetical protein SteCoe_30660 [Stentor coeruleus]